MTIFFDMDGTVADLYGVDDWLSHLISENPAPYEKAAPLQDLRQLARLLNRLQRQGVRIGVITWLSKNGSPAYNDEVRRAKRRWLAQHLPSVDWDEIHMVKYGTPKQRFCREDIDILFDDEQKNRDRWTGAAYEPSEILEILRSLI